MDKSYYEEMEAGATLDAAIAERVMGWTRGPGKYEGEFWHRQVEGSPWQTADVQTWSPSTDIAAAWQVVEALHARNTIFELCIHHGQLEGGLYAVSVTVTGAAGHAYGGKGASAPLAICRAALWAVDKAK